MPEADLTARQLDLIARIAALRPAPWFMGGYAEDALLSGSVTRPHEDVDVIFPRQREQLHMSQLAQLGFTEWETWGEAAPGVPFYLFGQSGDLKVDVGLLDQVGGENWMRVHRLAFTVGGEEAAAGYQLRLPDDTLNHPPVALEGIEISPLSPLALYQMRAGVARRNSFGPLSDRQLATMAELRERFFPDLSDADLMPPEEPLPR